MLSLGRKCQNWVEFSDTLLVSGKCLVLVWTHSSQHPHVGTGSRNPKEWSFWLVSFIQYIVFKVHPCHFMDLISLCGCLYNIAPCIHATFYLSIHHLVNIWVAFISWLLWKMLLWMFMYKMWLDLLLIRIFNLHEWVRLVYNFLSMSVLFVLVSSYFSFINKLLILDSLI